MDPSTEILNLIHRAEMTFDDGDFDGHMGLWGSHVDFQSPFGSADSAQAYRGFLEGFFQQVSSLGGTRHFVHNPVVTVDGDRARVRAYLHIINRRNGSFMGMSVLTDDLQRTPEGWRFSRRQVQPDQDLAQILGASTS